MKLLAILTSILFASCADPVNLQKQSIEAIKPSRNIGEKFSPTSFLKPSEILANKNDFHGKDVRVLAYYIPHHDGDWIAEVEGSFKGATISVPNTGKVSIRLKDGSIVDHPSKLNWGNSGRPVILEGKFIKNGVMHHMGLTMNTINMIYRSRIIEVGPKDKDWLNLYR